MILKRNLNLIICFVLFSLLISVSALSYAAYTASTSQAADPAQPFSDVPQTSYAYSAIHELRKLGITNGIGDNKYGYGRTLTRGEFVTFLVKLMDWEQVVPTAGSFADNRNVKKFYYAPIETALINDIISVDETTFRPDDNITREEAVVMIVSCLGYGELSSKLNYLDRPFEDVTSNVGAITIARDFGIASIDTNFNPSSSILREQAAAMLIRMRTAMERPFKELNAFYAFKSSPQMDKIPDLTSVCFGWSKISFDQENVELVLNTTKNTYGNNDFSTPTGFTSPLSVAKEAGVPAMLMVYSSQDEKIQHPTSGQKIGIPEYLLTNQEAYQKVISDIIAYVKNPSNEGEIGSPFDGVVIDFENLRGETLKQNFNAFLKELDVALEFENKKLF
ncbi:MAG: S-layer homology domain-containing protein, partial [Clostridia bacterium]|nr:S-layer homology domain-containing protein [Clostridia bacterium]